MGIKLLWTGLTLIDALTPALQVLGINPQKGIVELVGAVLMLIGLYLIWRNE